MAKVRKILRSVVCMSLMAAPSMAWAQAAPGSEAASPPAPAPTAAATATPETQGAAVDLPGSASIARDTPLAVGDAVAVRLIGRSEFNVGARVANDGVIILPLLGQVKALGKTVDQLADDIRQALVKGGFYADPVVRVDIVAVAGRYATVLGHVGSPGLISLDRPYKLSELIARVGGRNGAGASYIVLTHTDGKSERYVIDDLATGAGPDPVVVHGDKIFIPPIENELFYINGQVRSPGSFPATPNMTIRLAIARAGGVTDMGNEKKIKLVRDGKQVKGVTPDEKLKPGDVLTIGERLF